MAIEDISITTRTKAALATDERAGVLDIEVETIDGVVHLRGEVESEQDRLAVANVAATVQGVRGVCNHLQVMRLRPPIREHIDLPDSRPFADGEGAA